MDEIDPICQALRTRRTRLRLTQKQVAQRAGCSQPSISDWENGFAVPTLTNLGLWLEALGGTLLLEFDDTDTEEVLDVNTARMLHRHSSSMCNPPECPIHKEAMEDYRTGTGQMLRVHPESKCHTQWCVIHRPMSGPWDGWPTHWRFDREIMERICPHGIGHPAREQSEMWARQGREHEGVHGCDGCCSRKVMT